MQVAFSNEASKFHSEIYHCTIIGLRKKHTLLSDPGHIKAHVGTTIFRALVIGVNTRSSITSMGLPCDGRLHP